MAICFTITSIRKSLTTLRCRDPCFNYSVLTYNVSLISDLVLILNSNRAFNN